MSIGHERLHVYQKALAFVSWTHEALGACSMAIEALDHWVRAGDSIVENLANGNSRRSQEDRNRYFDVAIGSALECAACLDVCLCRDCIQTDLLVQGKQQLRVIVDMSVGLRSADYPGVKESADEYTVESGPRIYFSHEKLDAYQTSLRFMRWLHVFFWDAGIPKTAAAKLDKMTTSVVLNVAEGNGRFGTVDQRRFIDIAATAALRVAAGLDLLVARRQAEPLSIAPGKEILGQCIPLLFGLRRYLDEKAARE